jgi:hypothetical protein
MDQHCTSRFRWFFYSLFGVASDEIWGMIKTTALYQLPGYKILELVVISEPISSSNNYDPTSISRSSYPVMAEERTHSQAREQRPSRISVQNMDVDVDVDEDDEEEQRPAHIHSVYTRIQPTREQRPARIHSVH